MRWTLLIATLLIISSAAALDLSIEPSSVTVLGGEDVSLTYTITNDASETVDVTGFERTDTVANVDVSTPSVPITLEPSESTTVSATLSVAANAAEGGYTVTIRATDSTSATATDSIALTVQQPSGFVFDDLEIGSSDQEREEIVTGSFTITNDRTAAVNGFSITNAVPDRYEFTLTGVPSTLEAFESATVSYSMTVPDDQDSGREQIGQMQYSSDSVNGAVDVFLETESGLRIRDIDVESESDSDNNLDDGETINIDFTPGEEVTFSIEVENILGVDMNDVEINIFIDDIDDGDELDEDSERDDIRDGDDVTFDITFDIPRDADEDTYEVIITVIGDDDNGADHETVVELELEVQRERDELRVDRFDLLPIDVCPGDDLTADITIRNVGSRDQDDARVTIELLNLDVADDRRFAIERAGDRDDEYDVTFSLDIPDDAEPGRYTARVVAYYDVTDITDVDQLDFSVDDCNTAPPPPSTPPTSPPSSGDDGIVIIQPQPPTTPPPSSSDGGDESTSLSLRTVLLVGLNVFVVLLIIAVIAALFRR